MTSSQYWFLLAKDLEASGDYARAIASYYNAKSPDKIYAIANSPDKVLKILNSKPDEDLQKLVEGLQDNEDMITNDGNDPKILKTIDLVMNIAVGILDKRWGVAQEAS